MDLEALATVALIIIAIGLVTFGGDWALDRAKQRRRRRNARRVADAMLRESDRRTGR
jgi:type II secretory pathway pseudopilin PulG